jgi:addiction module HigA family antidote
MALTAIHPGEHLAEELKELKMSAAELARKMAVPTNRITGILNGRRAITGDTALRLAHFFGTSAEFWLNLQSLYELRIAESKVGKSIKALPKLRHPARISAWGTSAYIIAAHPICDLKAVRRYPFDGLRDIRLLEFAALSEKGTNPVRIGNLHLGKIPGFYFKAKWTLAIVSIATGTPPSGGMGWIAISLRPESPQV